MTISEEKAKPLTLYGPLADALMTVAFRRYIAKRYEAWAKRARREYARELREERQAGRPTTPPTWAPQRMPPPSTPALRSDYTHNVIDHAEAYVDGTIHTNGLENFWSLLKRTIKGTYVSIEPFHLFRYLDEQAFRFNHRSGTDATRFALALHGVLGKRLTYDALTGAGVPERC